MERLSPLGLIIVGAGLVLAGWLVPFLMVLKVLEASFALCFLSYAALLTGMVLGVMGGLQHMRLRGREDGRENG